MMAGTTGVDAPKQIVVLGERYKCPHFRILIIGRANAGKTTILEKVCGVQQGTKPIIYDQNGEKLVPSVAHLMPSVERGMHNIEHQITYDGSNFIFHDSRGFESGAIEELEVVWKFIEKQSAATELKDQLHAIWYCIPMDSPRPLLSAELGFFTKGTGGVPLVTIFTKFDGQIVAEYVKLNNIENVEDRWEKAKDNAEISFQKVYLPKVLNTEHPPKAHVRLEDMDIPENNCPELTDKTADAIDDIVLKELFISTQKNNLNLSVKYALQTVLAQGQAEFEWHEFIVKILCKFPHFWIEKRDNEDTLKWERIRNLETGNQVDGSANHTVVADYSYQGGDHGIVAPLEGRASGKELRENIISKLFSSFGETTPQFSANPTACQILVAIIVLAKISFWIRKPLHESIMDALIQFEEQDYVRKLKTHITSESMPPGHEDLVAFLCDETIHL